MDAEGRRRMDMEKKRRITSYQFSCRVSTSVLMAAAAISMAVNREISNLGVKMEANYTSLSAFKFFVGLSAAISAYSLLSMVFFCSGFVRMGVICVLDMVATSLALATLSSAAAVAHIGKYGEADAGWPPVCGFFPHFCNQTAFCLVACFLGFASSFNTTASLCLAMAET